MLFVWLHRFKKQNTISYFFTSAESVEKAREKILEKAALIKQTTTDCVFNSEGVEYFYKSSPLGAADGVLHLGAPDSITTEEVCYLYEQIKNTLDGAPLFTGPDDSVGFVTAKG